jgi:hypothetical protein
VDPERRSPNATRTIAPPCRTRAIAGRALGVARASRRDLRVARGRNRGGTPYAMHLVTRRWARCNSTSDSRAKEIRTMRAALAILALTTALLSLFGCANEPQPAVAQTRSVAVADEPTVLGPIQAALAGHVRGNVGPVVGLSEEATELSTYDDGYYVTVEAVVEQQDRAIMTLLSVSNVGDLFLVGNGGSWALGSEDENGTRVTMLGCVGDEVGIYNEYDKPADEVDVIIDAPTSELPNEMDVTVQGRFYDRDENGQKLDTFNDATTTFTLVR